MIRLGLPLSPPRLPPCPASGQDSWTAVPHARPRLLLTNVRHAHLRRLCLSPHLPLYLISSSDPVALRSRPRLGTFTPSRPIRLDFLHLWSFLLSHAVAWHCTVSFFHSPSIYTVLSDLSHFPSTWTFWLVPTFRSRFCTRVLAFLLTALTPLTHHLHHLHTTYTSHNQLHFYTYTPAQRAPAPPHRFPSFPSFILFSLVLPCTMHLHFAYQAAWGFVRPCAPSHHVHVQHAPQVPYVFA